jgi:hypothetical protein
MEIKEESQMVFEWTVEDWPLLIFYIGVALVLLLFLVLLLRKLVMRLRS